MVKLVLLSLLFIILAGEPNEVGGGKVKSKKGKAKASGSACRGLVQAELGSYDRLLQRAAELSQTRELDAAQACLDTALDLSTNAHAKAHVIFNLAVIARQRGDVEGAKKILLQAPKEGMRGWAQANMFLGILQMESGESREALASLSRAKSLSPEDPAIYRDMAQGYYNLGEAPMAVHVWKEGVVNMPSNSEGFFNLGLLQRELGGADAEQCYKTAVRLQPDSARYRYSYGNLLYDRERLADAASVYEGALRLLPIHEDALNNLGNALRQLGRLDGAKHAFERGLHANPLNTNLLLNAGQVYQVWHVCAYVRACACVHDVGLKKQQIRAHKTCKRTNIHPTHMRPSAHTYANARVHSLSLSLAPSLALFLSLSLSISLLLSLSLSLSL